MMSDWEIVMVRPTDEALWKQCIDVRLKVFVEEQGFPNDTEVDDYDRTAVQFLLRERESYALIGVVRLNPPPTLKLARLCVLPAHRKMGHAERLVRAAHDWVISNAKATTRSTDAQPDQVVVWLHAQLLVIRFYERLGYACVGDQFVEEGAPHQRMEIRLSIKSSAPWLHLP